MNKKPTYYLQTDKRWSSLPYRVAGENTTIGHSGCGPTAAAMLIETLTGKTFTPVDACRWSVEHGFKALGQGTYYTYFKPQFAEHGIGCDQLSWENTYGRPDSQTHKKAFAMLRQGYYLIALMGKGLWTSSGHFVVVWWEDGKVRINDPASTKAVRLEGNMRTFCGQVKYYWWVDARDHNNEEEIDVSKEDIQAMVDAAVIRELAERDASQARVAQTVSPWAADAWENAVKKGLFDGTRPGGALTREQAAVVLDRSGLLK